MYHHRSRQNKKNPGINKNEIGNSFSGGGGAALSDCQDGDFNCPVENFSPKKNGERPHSSLKKVQSPKPNIIF
jgi:hypothetical protein